VSKLDTVPDDFQPHFKQSRFTDPWEPLYSRIVEGLQVQIGVVLSAAHCNSRNMVHGGFLAALADNAIGLSCGQAIIGKGREVTGLVTTNLAIDYVGKALVGQWIATDTQVIKVGRSLCVASALIKTHDMTVARVNATFQITGG